MTNHLTRWLQRFRWYRRWKGIPDLTFIAMERTLQDNPTIEADPVPLKPTYEELVRLMGGKTIYPRPRHTMPVSTSWSQMLAQQKTLDAGCYVTQGFPLRYGTGRIYFGE